jgi:glycosyltransferase involved in cell wall biosynthesis
VKTNIDLTILSCRSVSTSDQSQTHEFIVPLLQYVVYPKKLDIIQGLFIVFLSKPLVLVKLLLRTLQGSLNIFSAHKVIAAFLYTLGWIKFLSDRKSQPEWIHADFGQHSATVAFMLSQFFNIPFSFKVHAFDIYDRRLQNLDLLQITKLNHAKIIFSEHGYGKQFLSNLAPHLEEKIIVNYTSIRPDDFQVLPPSMKHYRFVALGRLVPKKGFNFLIEAVSILHDEGHNLVVDILGSGPEETRLKALIEEKKVQNIVNLLGSYKNEELPNILSDCLAVIVPSITDKNGDMDGIPTVIYEAMALGRPVIASKISGIPEVVLDEVNGYLVDPGDATQIASKIRQFILNDNIFVKMGLNGRQKVECEHNYIHNAKSMIDHINQSF